MPKQVFVTECPQCHGTGNVNEAVVAKKKKTATNMGYNKSMTTKEFQPQVILQLAITNNREPQIFRIVQCFRSSGSPHCMGMCLELLQIDALGQKSWVPGDNIPDWVEALIGRYLYPIDSLDRKILDWLDGHSRKGWVCVNPFNRTGLRLNEITKDVAGTDDRVYATIREAVIAEMDKEKVNGYSTMP